MYLNIPDDTINSLIRGTLEQDPNLLENEMVFQEAGMRLYYGNFSKMLETE